MVDYKYADLFWKDSINKKLKIITDDGIAITNEDLHSENFELTESLCSESRLTFGCCEASVLKFKISNIFTSLKDKWITVTSTLEWNTDEPFQFGRYKVYSDKPTADRKHRDIVAYDAMYDIINSDVADWYNDLLPDESSVLNLKQFRASFIEHFGLEQEEVALINDDMMVARTIEPAQLSGKDVITRICELNGCFGHIGRDGKFHYVFLDKYIEGLYPNNDLYPRNDLYPKSPRSTRIGRRYISCKYEDFITGEITKLQIRQNEGDVGAISGTGDNCYIIEDNFLVYGKSASELEQVANNLFSVISEVSYRPFEADVQGNPCVEVGDAVRLVTKYEIVESYVLQRTLKGIQGIRDSYEADGEEQYAEKVNSVNKSIIQLKNVTNTLTRTVDETRSELTNAQEGLYSAITQNVNSIKAEVERASEAEGNLSSAITQTAESITAEVKRASEAEGNLSSKITQTAESIKTEISQTYETKDDAGNSYNTLRSSIEQTAGQIALKVDKGDVSNQLSVEESGVRIAANRLTVESDNFTLSGSGEMNASGTLSAGNSDGKKAVISSGEINFYNDEVCSGLISTLLEYSEPGLSIKSGAGFCGIGFIDDNLSYESSTIQGLFYFMSNMYEYPYRHNFFDSAVFRNGFDTGHISFLGGDGEPALKSAAVLVDGSYKHGTLANNILKVDGNFICTGEKNRAVKTENYGTVLMNALETAGAYFSDIGSGRITDGVCYVYFDSVFAETIDIGCEYQVLITRTSEKEATYVEKCSEYFIVHGEDGATFDWVVFAKQKDYQLTRMDSFQAEVEEEIPYDMSIFYGNDTAAAQSASYMEEFDDNIDDVAYAYVKDYAAQEQAIIDSSITAELTAESEE